jgi:hypothetical protein
MPTTVTKRISGAASGGKTVRVSEAPTGAFNTSRISFLLALEGDQEGVLLLEGDMQDIGTDALKLEGDVTAIGATITKRVTEPVV